MSVTLTIKQVPDELAARLRALAAHNHRSIQGELMHTLETLLAGRNIPATEQQPAAETELRARPAPASDDLLAKLDHIVAGTHWGEAPLLSRDQANDRSLIREIDHLVQERQAIYRR